MALRAAPDEIASNAYEFNRRLSRCAGTLSGAALLGIWPLASVAPGESPSAAHEAS